MDDLFFGGGGGGRGRSMSDTQYRQVLPLVDTAKYTVVAGVWLPNWPHGMPLCSLGFTCRVICTFPNLSMCHHECKVNFPQPAGSQSYYVNQKLCTPAMFDWINFVPNSKFNTRVLLQVQQLFFNTTFSPCWKTIAGRRRTLVLNAKPARMAVKRIVSPCSADTHIQTNTHMNAHSRTHTHTHNFEGIRRSRLNNSLRTVDNKYQCFLSNEPCSSSFGSRPPASPSLNTNTHEKNMATLPILFRVDFYPIWSIFRHCYL